MATRESLSKTVHYFSWIALLLCMLASAAWVALVADGNYCWGAFVFMMAGGNLSALILAVVILPGSVLYVQRRQRRDFRTVWFGGCSLLILLVEIVLVVWVIPQRGE